MSVATVIQDRFRATGARDPDSLHGLLYLVEGGNSPSTIGGMIHERNIGGLLERARKGQVGRIEAFRGSEHRHEVIDFPDGLIPYRWKREIVALCLSANGATTTDIAAILTTCNVHREDPIKVIRADLSSFNVTIDGEQIPGQPQYRYRILGRCAWRMQKIIGNGWTL